MGSPLHDIGFWSVLLFGFLFYFVAPVAITIFLLHFLARLLRLKPALRYWIVFAGAVLVVGLLILHFLQLLAQIFPSLTPINHY